MYSRKLFLAAAAVILTAFAQASAIAQQVTVESPFQAVNHSFFEQMGIDFDFNIRGGGGVFGINPDGSLSPDIQFRQGSFATAVPPFGGFSPLSPASRAGVALLGNDADAFFNFAFGQGSSTSNVMQSPVITLTNGVPGSISDQIQTPFVLSVTPVLGNFPRGRFGPVNFGPQDVRPMAPYGGNPILERYRRLQAGEARPAKTSGSAGGGRRAVTGLSFSERLDVARESTAGQPAASVAEIRRGGAVEKTAAQDKALEDYERAAAAEKAGKRGVAKIYYRMAARAATGTLKKKAEARLRALSARTSTNDTQ